MNGKENKGQNTMKTIRKNSKRIKNLKDSAEKVTVYSLNNNFVGVDVAPENMGRILGLIQDYCEGVC
jgi:hypothetical protein